VRLGKRGGGAEVEVEGSPPKFIGGGGAAEKEGSCAPPKERGDGAEEVGREKEGGGAVEKERGCLGVATGVLVEGFGVSTGGV